jgi:hypothetical protein
MTMYYDEKLKLWVDTNDADSPKASVAAARVALEFATPMPSEPANHQQQLPTAPLPPAWLLECERGMNRTRLLYAINWLLAVCGAVATIAVAVHLRLRMHHSCARTTLTISLMVVALAQLVLGGLTLYFWRGHEDALRRMHAKRNRSQAYAHLGHEETYLCDQALAVFAGTVAQCLTAAAGILMLLLWLGAADSHLPASTVGVVCMCLHFAGLCGSMKRLEIGD